MTQPAQVTAVFGRTATGLNALKKLLRDSDDFGRLFDPAKLRGTGRVIDVATGAGQLAREFRAADVEADGVDLVLEPWQEQENWFRVGAAWQLPYRTSTVSNLFEVWGPTWFAERWRRAHWSTLDVLREYARVLRPGGVMRIGPVPQQSLVRYLTQVPGLQASYAAPTRYHGQVFFEATMSGRRSALAWFSALLRSRRLARGLKAFR